jgi:hypothetical protein
MRQRRQAPVPAVVADNTRDEVVNMARSNLRNLPRP